MRKVVVLHEDQTPIRMTSAEQDAAQNAAIFVTASPHEHVWKQEDQVLMARYVLWAYQRLSAIAQVATQNNL